MTAEDPPSRLRAAARLRVTVCDTQGRPLREPGLAAWLARVAPRGAAGTVTLVLAGDAAVRRLNRTWRGVDAPTDVLSFPAGDPPPIGRRVDRHLGDLVIARGIAARQARAHGHATPVELRVLALHGLLHLLGYDHECDAGEMARVERRLRRAGGLEAGLIERAPRARGQRRPRPRNGRAR